MLKTIRHAIGTGLIIYAMVLLIWATLPVRQEMMEQIIMPAEMQLPNNEQPKQAVLENRQVMVEWPESMRIGEVEEIRLTFEPSEKEGVESSSGIGLSNIYNHYNLMAEGRFEVAGVKVEPANPLRESLPPGQSITYKWRITAEKTGLYTGRVWLSLRFLPLDGKAPTQSPIFVTSINLKLTSLWGISGPAARLLGGLVIIFGILANIDVMIAWMRKKLSLRTRRNSK
jgi:hypothetical protein